MKVYAYDPYLSTQYFNQLGVLRTNSLIDLAKKVDILTLHVPLNRETKGMVNKDVLMSLKRESYIINAARGGVIDEDTLLKCLQSNYLNGAAIDTWQREPTINAKLAKHPKVICTPHIGASTNEAQNAIGDCIVKQVIKALDGGVVDYPVNLPQIGFIDNILVKPYTTLAEKMGKFAGQLIEKNPAKIEAFYSGDLAEIDHSLIRLGWMKGFTSCAMTSYISFVNAEEQFSKLGLPLTDYKDANLHDYKSAIKFVIYYENGDFLSIGGIVFDATHIRISTINEYHFEFEPSGYLLVLRNNDKPGVIGSIGMLLAKEGINIDCFELSRNNPGGNAMAIIKVDGEKTVMKNLDEKLMQLDNVYSCKIVVL